MKIPFGSKLNVSKLQEEYGVSSTPVREALNRLLNEGLIEFENNVGARVIDITEEDVREIQEIAFAYQMVAAIFGFSYPRAFRVSTVFSMICAFCSSVG